MELFYPCHLDLIFLCHEILNQQLTVLRAQLASLQDALDASDAKNKEQQANLQELQNVVGWMNVAGCSSQKNPYLKFLSNLEVHQH